MDCQLTVATKIILKMGNIDIILVAKTHFIEKSNLNQHSIYHTEHLDGSAHGVNHNNAENQAS